MVSVFLHDSGENRAFARHNRDSQQTPAGNPDICSEAVPA